VFIVITGKQLVLLNKIGEIILHHYLFLFTSQNAFLVQLSFMLSKHIPKTLFGENHVSSRYLAQIGCRSTNQSLKILDLDIWCPLRTQVSHYYIRNVKQTYTIYVISCYSRLKTRF
jgi:hypothetical protein